MPLVRLDRSIEPVVSYDELRRWFVRVGVPDRLARPLVALTEATVTRASASRDDDAAWQMLWQLSRSAEAWSGADRGFDPLHDAYERATLLVGEKIGTVITIARRPASGAFVRIVAQPGFGRGGRPSPKQKLERGEKRSTRDLKPAAVLLLLGAIVLAPEGAPLARGASLWVELLGWLGLWSRGSAAGTLRSTISRTERALAQHVADVDRIPVLDASGRPAPRGVAKRAEVDRARPQHEEVVAAYEMLYASAEAGRRLRLPQRLHRVRRTPTAEYLRAFTF